MLAHGDFLLKMPNFGLKMDFWVYESSLCIREVPKLSFGIKSEVNGKWFSRVSSTVALAYHKWMPAITCQEAVISSLRSFFRSILHSFLEIQFENSLKNIKMVIFGQKLEFWGTENSTEKFSWWCHDCIIKRMKTTIRYFGVLVLLTKVKKEYFWYRSKFSRTKNWTTLLWPSSFLFTPWLTTRGLRSTAIDHGLSTISPRTGLQWTLYLNFNNWQKTSRFWKKSAFLIK